MKWIKKFLHVIQQINRIEIGINMIIDRLDYLMQDEKRNTIELITDKNVEVDEHFYLNTNELNSALDNMGVNFNGR